MTQQEHLLVRCMEECNELSQRISKILNFGSDQVQKQSDDRPDQNPERLNNFQRAINEYHDLIAVMDMAGFHGGRVDSGNQGDDFAVHFDRDKIDAKVKKVGLYIIRAEKCLTLEPSWEHRTCEETTGMIGDDYTRCGAPAAMIVQHRGRREGPYFMCLMCGTHNARNRNGQVLVTTPATADFVEPKWRNP